RDRPLERQAGLDALQGFWNETGVGLGQVVADAEGPMQFVQSGGPEAGIGRSARRPAAADHTPRRQTRADHLARALGINLVQRRRAGGPITLQPTPVLVLPAVQTQAPSEQPRPVLQRALAVDARHRGLAPGDAVSRVVSGHVAEPFMRLALVETRVGADLPFQTTPPQAVAATAQGGVQAPARGRRLVLIIG